MKIMPDSTQVWPFTYFSKNMDLMLQSVDKNAILWSHGPFHLSIPTARERK